LDKVSLVWLNLTQLGYRNDLKLLSDVSEVAVNCKELPRYILSNEPRSFELFFRLLDVGGENAELAWDIISKLTTNP